MYNHIGSIWSGGVRLGTGNITFILVYVAFFVCILLYFFFVFVENHIESEVYFRICFMCDCICFVFVLYLFRFFCICLKITVARRCEAWDGRASTGGGGGQR